MSTFLHSSTTCTISEINYHSPMDSDEPNWVFESRAAHLLSQCLESLDFEPDTDARFISYGAQSLDTIDPSVISIPSTSSYNSSLPDPILLSDPTVLPTDPSHVLPDPNSLDDAAERFMQEMSAFSVNISNIPPFSGPLTEGDMNMFDPTEPIMPPVLSGAAPYNDSTILNFDHVQHEPSDEANMGNVTSSLPIRQKNSNSTSIMNAWLNEHLHKPYATPDEKKELADATGWSFKQVTTWLSNARKRDTRLRNNRSSSTGWEHIPDEDDRGRRSSYSTSSGRESSCESVQTAFSASSEGLLLEKPKRGRKRKYSNDVSSIGQRKRSISQSPSVTTDDNSKPIFQCTFCGDPLSRKAWKRHEETKHLPQAIWTCMATGPIVDSTDLSTGRRMRTCAFCGDEVEGEDCPRKHRIEECSTEKREFNRKDKLRQHFRNFHPGSEFTDKIANLWRSQRSYANTVWHCGFCQVVLTDWHLRAIHIEKHFLDGMTIDKWQEPEENSGSAPSTIQADLHVQHLVQQGILFQCPPNDDDIGPHSHCFHPQSLTAGMNSKYFPGCESIRLGLLQHIEDSFTQYHIWTCGKGVDLVLCKKGTSGAIYWIRCSIDALTLRQPSSIFEKQFLAHLCVEKEPDFFVQGSDRGPILERELNWSKSKNFNILLKFSCAEHYDALSSFLSSRNDKLCPKSDSSTTWDCTDYLPQDKLIGKFFKAAATPDIGYAGDDRSEAFEEMTVADDNQSRDLHFSDTKQDLDDLDIQTMIDEAYLTSPAQSNGRILTTSPSVALHTSGSFASSSHGQSQSTPIYENLLREYTCGDPRYRGKAWGCLKKFNGLNGIADHLRSPRGRRCKCRLLWLQEQFPISSTPLDPNGLPIALFEIYPGLATIDFNRLKKWDGHDGDDDEEDGRFGGQALSVIWSVSSKSKSSRVTAVVQMESFGLESHSPRHGHPLRVI